MSGSPGQVIFEILFSKLSLWRTLFSWAGHFIFKSRDVSPGQVIFFNFFKTQSFADHLLLGRSLNKIRLGREANFFWVGGRVGGTNFWVGARLTKPPHLRRLCSR